MPVQQIARFLDNASLRQDPCARLLLLVAKTKLTAEQRAEARRLAEGVVEWEEFATIAARKFVATYAYRHLNAAAADIIPPAPMALLRQFAYASTFSNLRAVAAHLAFHRKCIVSTGANHAYLKGFALAVQCSQNIGDRPCRDIDVLIAARDMRSVLDAAAASGYIIYVDPALTERATGGRDLDFLSRHADVVTIVGQEAIPIELHRRLDKQSVEFPLDDALATTEKVQLSGVTIQTLSKPLHFNYICYHHARHFWSKLHWLADVDAMASASDFDPSEVARLAGEIGIRPTTDAALEFSKLASKSELWGQALDRQRGGDVFLAACLFNLDGDLELEQELRKGMPFNDFMSNWQITRNRYDKFAWNAWLSRLRPTPRQYLRHRLPRQLHWLYLVRNGLARENVAQAAGLVAHSAGRALVSAARRTGNAGRR